MAGVIRVIETTAKSSARPEPAMSLEVNVLNGNESWPLVEPLFKAVWPAEVLATLPWGRFAFAYPELRVVLQTESGDAVCHVGIHRREVKWNGRRIRAGGIGGVLTEQRHRRIGYATLALSAAIQTLKDEGSTDFALLFCEPHNAPFFVGRGWMPFEGEIYAEQPQGRIRFDAVGAYAYQLKGPPRQGTIDLCGLPW
jgi:aminoglycoside 2'-N-acetyltransferase I